jgi:hypothetical protein
LTVRAQKGALTTPIRGRYFPKFQPSDDECGPIRAAVCTARRGFIGVVTKGYTW